MPQLFHVEGSRSPVTLQRTAADSLEYDICVEGVPAYRFGMTCGTCDFFFKRLPGADAYGTPANRVRDLLNSGIDSVDDEVLTAVSPILPDGGYQPVLTAFVPVAVQYGEDLDYFEHEARAFWDPIDRGEEYRPRFYYRGRTLELGDRRCLFEFVAPIVDTHLLDAATVDAYERLIREGGWPTALALSMFEIKEPTHETGLPCDQHWLLTHYLLDGHHKVAAAHRLGAPVRMLSLVLAPTSKSLHDPGGTMPPELITRLELPR